MATQFHVAHSTIVNSVGLFAGGTRFYNLKERQNLIRNNLLLYYIVPYGCALGLVAESLNCMLYPNTVIMANLYARVSTYDFYVSIDTVNGMVNDRVFIFQGTLDSVVKPRESSLAK